MADAILIFDPGYQVTNSSGTIQASAKLKFYDAGTTNSRQVYSDPGLTSSLGTGVDTNAAGRPSSGGSEVLCYASEGNLKVVALTSASESLWSFDNVIGALDTTGFSAAAALPETPVLTKTASYVITSAEKGYIINFNASGSVTATLPSAATMGDGWRVTVRNVHATGDVTIATVGGETIDGGGTTELLPGRIGLTLVSDAANWHVVAQTGVPREHLIGSVIINGSIAESNNGTAATFALKTTSGTDPSPSDPVVIGFRNSTQGNGRVIYRQVVAALSLTVSSGSTLGSTDGTAFRVWLVLFDNSGTILLGAINCLSGTNIYALGKTPLASSSAEGGAGGADSAQTFYTSSAVTSKPYVLLGYATYESGQTTAGTWAASPTTIQEYGPGIPLPGDTIQTVRTTTGAVATGTTLLPTDDDTIPQNTEGNQYMSQAITPVSAANILNIRSQAHISSNAGGDLGSALFQDSTANALTAVSERPATTAKMEQLHINYSMQSGTTSSTTFNIRAGNPNAGTTTFNGVSGGRLMGGVINSYLEIEEIMA